MDTWKQYSGMWPLQTQMQAAAASNWPGSSLALYSWGRNNYGQLGQNDLVDRSYPTQVGNLNNWQQISLSGNDYLLALKTNGTLWSWGMNISGQLGQNDRVYRSSPVQVGALTNWYKVSCGQYSSLAIKTDGTLWSWGYNLNGELGQNDLVNRSSPVQVGALTDWSNVLMNGSSAFVTKTNNTLWSWGANDSGQLGQNDLVNRSSPVQVGALTDWSTIYTEINVGVLAIKTNNSLWSWGQNNVGQLCQNDRVLRSSPVQVGALTDWQSASNNGDSWFILVKTNNSLWSCGANNNGELGQGDIVFRSSPVQVGALTNWKNVSASDFGSFATKTDGTLWSWGRNGYGDLGKNNIVDYSSPVQIGSSASWSNIFSGGNASVALYKA